jgi:hypothetical protein
MKGLLYEYYKTRYLIFTAKIYLFLFFYFLFFFYGSTALYGPGPPRFVEVL